METYRLFIGGEWIEGDSGTYIEVENPATKKAFARVPEGNGADVEKTVEAAERALPQWSGLAPEERAAYIDKIADYFEEHKEEIGKTVTKELGAPKKMVIDWHVASPVAEARFFAETARTFPYEEKKEGVIIRREPVGIVAGITPWNYPLDQVTVKLLPALSAGNCVIVKPSQQTPLSVYALAKAVEAAGMPKGVFNVVTGRGGAVGNLLAAHKKIRMISFTGSTGAGIEVGRIALSNVKKIALELGGKSASVLLKSGDMKKAVESTLLKCFMNTGQTCSALTRFIVPRERKEETEVYMKEFTQTLKVGDPMDETVDIGPVVNENAFKKIKGYIEKGLEEGADMIVGKVPETCENGYYVEPVIFTEVDNKMVIAREEIFGPVLCVIYYDREDEALEIANDSPYGLSGAVFGEDEEARAFAEKMETGVIHVNGAPFTVQAPFGGYKESGIGRENSVFSFDEYLEIKSVLV